MLNYILCIPFEGGTRYYAKLRRRNGFVRRNNILVYGRNINGNGVEKNK